MWGKPQISLFLSESALTASWKHLVANHFKQMKRSHESRSEEGGGTWILSSKGLGRERAL